ncbi:hypothetical protein OAL35_01750 [bacterium]|nr:hypothetical protein [bacterium]
MMQPKSISPVASKSSSKDPSKTLSILLANGRGGDAIKILNDNVEWDFGNWSEGRIAWYKSLAYRVSGEQASAALWLSKAKTFGIPELKSTEWFFDQQQYWSSDLLLGSDQSTTLEGQNDYYFVSVLSAADSIAETARRMVDEIRREQDTIEDEGSDAELINTRVKLATWELLLGEYTSFHHSLALWTTSVDSFVKGKRHLQEIESEIALNSELDAIISSDPEVAIRLDSARVRLVAIENKESLSRAQEVSRLHQLRKIAKNYREILDSMLKWQSYLALEDSEKGMDAASQTLASLSELRKTIEERGDDFHLFDDESPIDSDSEFAILDIAPKPFSDSTTSHLKASKAYESYLRAIGESADETSASFLQEAEDWAKASLESADNVADISEGADPDNLLGLLTVGLVTMEKANALSLSPEKSLRDRADVGYQDAREKLTQLKNLTEANGYSDSYALPEKIDSAIKVLKDRHDSEATALKLFLAGNYSVASDHLLRAIKAHRHSETARNSVLVGIHSGISPSELGNQWLLFRDAGIFPEDDSNSALCKAMIDCLDAGRVVAGQYEDASTQLETDLGKNYTRLLSVLSDTDLPVEQRNAIKAYLGLTQAYRSVLASKDQNDANPIQRDAVKEAYRHARDAEFFFQGRIGSQDATLKSFTDLLERDALIASRLAMGHLAASHLDEWRDESRIFLSAATQEAAKLPRVEPLLPLLGEPLLKQLFNGTNQSDQKLAAEERQRRQMVTRCLEALFVLRFGDPEAGARQMSKAVELGQLTSEVGGELDLAKLSESADGFDAKITLPDTIKAFEVLSLLEASEAESAFTKAIKLAGGGLIDVDAFADQKEDEANECINLIQSPFVAFVFAAATEAKLKSIPLTEEFERREWLAEKAASALRRGDEMLKELRLGERYPHIAGVMSQQLIDFTDGKHLLAKVRSEFESGNYLVSMKDASNALSKHPRDQDLWSIYLQAKLQITVSGSELDEVSLRDLVSEAEKAFDEQLITVFAKSQLLGLAFEELGLLQEASQSFAEAAKHASDEVSRIKAASKAERLRISALSASI